MFFFLFHLFYIQSSKTLSVNIIYDFSLVKMLKPLRQEQGPYKCMLTLTSKTRFGIMRDCQKQNRKGDLGGSSGFGWTRRPKVDNILLVRWGGL